MEKLTEDVSDSLGRFVSYSANVVQNVPPETALQLHEKLANESNLTFQDVQEVLQSLRYCVSSPVSRGSFVPASEIRFSASRSLIVKMYQELARETPVPISMVSRYAFCSDSGVEWFNVLVDGPNAYYFPISLNDKIMPLRVIEEGGVTSNMKRLRHGICVVEKVVMANKPIEFSPTEDVFDIPIRFEEKNLEMVGRGEMLMIGACVKDGLVVFPYNSLQTHMPLKQGEVILVAGKDVYSMFPVDVISSRRNFLLSILKGLYGESDSGSSFVYTVGSVLTFSTKTLLTVLKRMKLTSKTGVIYPKIWSKELTDKVSVLFEGMSFDFLQVFGETPIFQEGVRLDNDMLDNDIPFRYNNTVEEFMRGNVVMTKNWSRDVSMVFGIEVGDVVSLHSYLSWDLTQSALNLVDMYFQALNVDIVDCWINGPFRFRHNSVIYTLGENFAVHFEAFQDVECDFDFLNLPCVKCVKRLSPIKSNMLSYAKLKRQVEDRRIQSLGVPKMSRSAFTKGVSELPGFSSSLTYDASRGYFPYDGTRMKMSFKDEIIREDFGLSVNDKLDFMPKNELDSLRRIKGQGDDCVIVKSAIGEDGVNKDRSEIKSYVGLKVPNNDFKSALNLLSQKKRFRCVYNTINAQSGSSSYFQAVCKVYFPGLPPEEFLSVGDFVSKRDAEQDVARRAYEWCERKSV